MALQQPQERRKYPRMALNRLVRIKEESGITKQLIGINYSAGGMALNSEVPFHSGEFIELKFRLNEYEKKEVKITAEILKNCRQGNFYITNVKFVGELVLN